MNKCYIVGAGEFALERFSPEKEDYIIAADGGYAELSNAGYRIDEVVGDFDSLGYVPNHPCVTLHPAEKDDTDLALAFEVAFEKGYRDFLLFGAIGDRLDHTLANMQLLAKIREKGGHGFCIGKTQTISAVQNEKLCFEEDYKGVVSVFAITDAASGVHLRGLKYPLCNATISNNRAIGVSNAFTGQKSEIEVGEGALWIIWYENEGASLPVFKKN